MRNRATGAALGVFDTEYRDLWNTSLPREILYQVSVYALGWSEASGHPVPAVVLYPAGGEEHDDVVLGLGVAGGRERHIVLRAIDWTEASKRLAAGDLDGCRRLATRWVERPRGNGESTVATAVHRRPRSAP